MNIQHEHGRWGEDLAINFLKKAGLTIVDKNWHYKKAEIDIIAMDSDILVFIEVKTRASTDFGPPEAMINKRKQRLLIDAGMAYMRSIRHEWEIRFDIIAVLGTPGSIKEIKHFKDAFFPGIDYK